MSEAVYVVTQGAYSDYRIVAVFDNQATAERHAANLSTDAYDTAEVETYTIQRNDPQRTMVYRAEWRAVSGALREWSYQRWLYEGDDPIPTRPAVHSFSGRILSGGAATPEAARRVVTDAVARHKADQAGLT
jgi:hypothetical protein